MDDLISREQALDAIHDWKPSDVFDEFNPTTAFTIICALPSANQDLSGYSDRLWKSAYDRGYERCKQDAIDAVDVKCLHRGIVKGIQEIIEDLPSAQPEIIRCKECKYWKDSDGVYRRGFDAESKCPLNLKKVYEGTFYCGMAERRTDETD